jgi:uncharacterized delta-60 repeat protein
MFPANLAHSQTLVNKEWVVTNANPVGFDWYGSAVDENKQLITVGNTLVPGQGANMLVQKFNTDGNVLWQQSYNSSGSNNDYGVAITTDASNNVYVCGTTSSNNQYDVLVVKYNADGVQQWAIQYNSPFGMNDVATAIKVDASNNVYVASASESAGTFSDFLLLKLNPNGTNAWQKRYDYANLIEIPAGLEFDSNGNIMVVGASASDFTNWDYTIVRYNPDGLLQGVARNNVPGTGFDQPVAVKKDRLGNIYVTGKASSNGVNYDIKTVKFNSSLSVAWVRTFNGSGLEDVAKDLQIDDDGNVFVAGYSTKPNGLKEILILKYDTDGNTEWIHKQSAKDDSGDALAKSLDVDDEGKVYFIGEEKGSYGDKDVIIMKLDDDGQTMWAKNISSAAEETPAAIKVDNEQNIYVSAVEKQGAVAVYKTVKYSEFKRDTSVVRDSIGNLIYKAHELIVKFKESAINTNAIDDNIGTKQAEYGGIDYFLTPNALQIFNATIAPLCPSSRQIPNSVQSVTNPCGIKAIKIFKHLRTTDTTTISRMGEIIRVPQFWTSLVLEFPLGMDLPSVFTVLKTAPSIIISSEPNLIPSLASSSSSACGSDIKYINQHSLHNTGSFFGADINIEPAWNIIPTGGSSEIRCGIFDEGVDWRHKEFGYDGLDPSTSKVVAGWSFPTGSNERNALQADESSNSHGTACAGIIGAVRNNDRGIAGIAGANLCEAGGQITNGISMYSLHLFGTSTGVPSTLSFIYDAIVTSAMDFDHPNPHPIVSAAPPYAYRLNISSNSWKLPLIPVWDTEDNIQYIKQAVHFANRAKVTFCAARGNDGGDDRIYPSIIDDDWVLNIGGTGINGCYIHDRDNIPQGVGRANGEITASFGHNVDIGAPASLQLITTLAKDNTYQAFAGTSGATPHAAGVVGLMMSYINAPTPAYQNLAPEDCEHILELSAKDDDCFPGSDQYIGAGLLDAGHAMALIKRPNAVKHFGTKNPSCNFTISKNLETGRPLIYLLEDYETETVPYQIFSRVPSYTVKKFRLNATITHTLDPGESIVQYWSRPSSCDAFENIIFNISQNRNELLPRQRVTINSLVKNGNNVTCNMTGYVYEVVDPNNDAHRFWWPFDPYLQTANFEYTILTHKSPTISVNEQSKSLLDIKVFPNPSSNLNTILWNNDKVEEVHIQLFDMQGRFLKPVYQGNSMIGENKISSDIIDFPVGIYFYKIQMGDVIEYIKFIKQ